MSKPRVPGSIHYLAAGLVLLALSLGTACERLDRPTPPMARAGELSRSPVTFKDAIPLDYGNLVAVIPHATDESWAGLWFEAEDRSLRVVWVHVVEGRIHDEVVRIPRR